MKIINNVYEKAVKSLKKHNVDYPNPNGKVYKVFKILYLVFALLTVLMTVFFVAGMFLVYSASETKGTEFISKFMPNAIFFLVASAVFLLGMVLLILKKDLVAFVINLVSGSAVSFGLISHMTNVNLNKTGLHIDWWWRHFLPFLFCIVCLGALAYIRTKAKYVELRAYKNLIQTIYKQNKNVQEMSEDEFALFLENYDPRAIEEARIREKKQKGYKPLFDDKK